MSEKPKKYRVLPGHNIYHGGEQFLEGSILDLVDAVYEVHAAHLESAEEPAEPPKPIAPNKGKEPVPNGEVD